MSAGCGRLAYDPTDADSGVVAGADAVPIPACASGGERGPIAAFDATEDPSSEACDAGNALALDGLVAGLDRSDDGRPCSQWDGNGACGCVGVDLGEVTSISEIAVWSGAAGQACGVSCNSGSCGTGHTFNLFVAKDAGGYAFAGLVRMSEPSAPVEERRVAYSGDVRFLLACRDEWGAERDDVVVDYLAATCE